MNEDATVEELNDATTSAFSAFINGIASKATAINPQDISILITNATFDNKTYEGWNVDGFGYVFTLDSCAALYGGTFDIWQKIDNMPNGVYMLSASAFYEIGTVEDSYNMFKNNDERINNCKLYAVNITVSGNDTLRTSIANPFKGILPNITNISLGSTGSIRDGINVYTIPNSTA